MRTAVWSVMVGWLVVLTLGMGWLIWSNLRPTFSTQTNSTAVQSTAEATVSTTEFASLKESVDLLSTQVATLAGLSTTGAKTAPASTVPKVSPMNQSREFVIGLGSASTSNRDWTPTAAEITLDPSKYTKITGARWEAAGSIIGGELAVRLVDVTHSRIYYEAVLVFNSSNPTWQHSPTITLSAVPALYRLEIKSSSGEIGQLNDSRLVIETQ